ncbi:hypothetical protein [Streptomyces sp. NPDC057729]|uniref:hypothetical protein n=1 Tax=Streptomyces sp. NPDC057729 TaxID=3346230 RepID=UPI003698C936
MLSVKHDAGPLEHLVHLIERAVLVRKASELLRKVHIRIQRGRGARTARGPEVLEFSLQDQNPAGGHVRQSLCLFSFGLRASELETQIASLRGGTPEAVTHGTDTRGVRVRSCIQGVQAACELGDLGLSLSEEVEEDGCDLQ